MNWECVGYQRERYVNEHGLIVGEVERNAASSEISAALRGPYRTLGDYTSLANAKAAVERNYAPLALGEKADG